MPDLRTITQFSVFLVNKPGVLAQVTGALAAAKVNLTAMTLVDSQEHGMMRIFSSGPRVSAGRAKHFCDSHWRSSPADWWALSANCAADRRDFARIFWSVSAARW